MTGGDNLRMLHAFAQAARPLAQVNIAVPLLFGQGVAYTLHGAFSVEWLVVAHGWGILDHLFIVFANDYADRDTDDGLRTLVSGGSGVLVEGKLAPRSLLRAAVAMAMGLTLLSAAFFEERPLFLPLSALAILLLWAYSFRPLRLSHRGGGEWLQATGVGLLLPTLGYYAQSGDPFPPPWALGTSFVIAFAGHVLTALPDHQSDARANKRTFVVRFGSRRAMTAIVVLMLLSTALALHATPDLSTDQRVVIGLSGGLPLAVAALLGNAAAKDERLLFRFVILGGASQTGLWLGWTAALVMGAH